jgi:hypothetical protein
MEDLSMRSDGNLAIAQSVREESQRTIPVPASTPFRILPTLPPAPDRAEDLGLPDRFVEDLALKHLHRITLPTTIGVSNAMRVSPAIVRECLDSLKR